MATRPTNASAEQYLHRSQVSCPSELKPYYVKFARQYDHKLWHQLTLTIFDFLAQPQSAPLQIQLFEQFVRNFEDKLNQLRLVEIGVKVSKQLTEPKAILDFLSRLLSRVDKVKEPAAYVLALSAFAHAKLVFGDLPGTQKDIEECSAVLDGLGTLEPNVNAAFYGVAADYYKAKAAYGPYYKNSLLYLACVDPETDMKPEERLERAHDLSIAALLGDTIYNFGELLMHPILDSLDDTQFSWIKDLLFTFNEGSIGKFESTHSKLSEEPILASNVAFLRQKICLMALIEAVFKRTGDSRNMSFQTIAEETRLPQDEVEHLVMKALSLKLIRGSLDQVNHRALITWVQPRVLSRTQVGDLAETLDRWCSKLSQVEEFVHKQTPELFVQ